MSATNSDPNSENGSEVHLDLSGVSSEEELHDLFAHALRFPHFYGRNWDAFWDILTGFGCFPRRLILFGTENLRLTLPRAHEQLQTCFANCQREYPDDAPAVTWQ